jgi:hypothetical protein
LNASTSFRTGFGQHGDYVFGWEGDSLQRAMDNCRDAFGWPEACPELTILSDEEINECVQQPRVDEVVEGQCKYSCIPMSNLPLI